MTGIEAIRVLEDNVEKTIIEIRKKKPETKTPTVFEYLNWLANISSYDNEIKVYLFYQSIKYYVKTDFAKYIGRSKCK